MLKRAGMRISGVRRSSRIAIQVYDPQRADVFEKDAQVRVELRPLMPVLFSPW